MNNLMTFFKNLILKIYIFLKYPCIEYEHVLYYNNKKLLDYIKLTALKVAELENIKVLNVNFDKLNENETNEYDKAVGRFVYPNEYAIKNNIEIIPRIEITEKANEFVIIHELGHYFIYKRSQIQSEESADTYIEEFFEEYLPDFFKWVFQIDISIRTKKSMIYSVLQSYQYLKQCKSWLKNKNL